MAFNSTSQSLEDFIAKFPPVSEAKEASSNWLIEKPTTLSKVYRGPAANEISLDNGIIRRTLRITPNAATVALINHTTNESYLRAVKPEAIIKINGKDYEVGGLKGQPNMAFLKPEWLDKMTANPDAFVLNDLVLGVPKAPIEWNKKGRHAAPAEWPPRGVELKMVYLHRKMPGIVIEVFYELYDGIPSMQKRVTVKNNTDQPINVGEATTEILATVEAQSEVDTFKEWALPNLTAMSDYSFGGMSGPAANKTLVWAADPDYKTQVNYELKTPCVLISKLPVGPDVILPPASQFRSHRSFLLAFDGVDRETRGLAMRKFYRTLAPWSTESPLMMHLTSTDPKVVQTAMDQAAECGFEMVIFSFGSGLNAEDTSPENIAKFKGFVDYGHSKGLQVGCYSLLASRRIDDKNDVINPATGKTGGTIFGNSPCLCSDWGQKYFKSVQAFLSQTGMDLLEHDGSYPGDVCASTTHPGHQGKDDSQWRQWQAITDFYNWCRTKGIYLNVPDWYVLAGSNKTGMGYRETNWSLPRAEQHIHARQNLFDGTWTKTPTVGWMFVPLTEYHGGGPAATIEPLKDNLADYEQHLINCLAFGAQACYRGPRLYDSPETKAVVVKWVTWFKKHREILESDVIHLKRADGIGIDYVLHVNPQLPEKAMLVVFNPSDKAVTQNIKVPLKFSGLKGSASVSEKDGNASKVTLNAFGETTIKATIPAKGFGWWTFK